MTLDLLPLGKGHLDGSAQGCASTAGARFLAVPRLPTLFLSAFLSFLVEPLIAKMVSTWLRATPSDGERVSEASAV